MIKILRALAMLAGAALIVLTVVPAVDRPVTFLPHDVEHFAAFCATGLLWGAAFERRLFHLALAAVGFAVLLELIQIPLATRHARLEDLLVDGAALCIGLVLGQLMRAWLPAWRAAP